MKYLGSLLLAAASTLSAQYGGFAVTDDGRLYFTTSLDTGSNDFGSKIYRVTDRNLELFATGGGGDNPFGPNAIGPLVSGDGKITGWALNFPCASGSCGLSGLPRIFYRLQGADAANLTYDSLQISKNGRFLLGATHDVRVERTELPSARVADTGRAFGLAGGQSIANDGGAILRQLNSPAALVYYSPAGEMRSISESENFYRGSIDPQGQRVVYERWREAGLELVLTDTQGNNQRVISSAPARIPGVPPDPIRFGAQPWFANDGSLMYLDRDGQPMILPDGGVARRLATIDGGVDASILSGDGRIAWLSTRSGQLFRVRVGEDTPEEIIPTSPFVNGLGSFFALPGSVVHLTGTGLGSATRFLIGDRTVPVSDINGSMATVQVPWEYPRGGRDTLTIQGPGSPFVQRFSFTALEHPTINFERDYFLRIAHQDWRGVLTNADPARPGETIHIFARNMGPVDRPVATGERSPDPPARVTTPMACYLLEMDANGNLMRAQGLVVPFAGLSAGLIGIYHIDATIPAEWKTERAMLQCRMDSGSPFYTGDSALIPVAITSPGGGTSGPQQQ